MYLPDVLEVNLLTRRSRLFLDHTLLHGLSKAK